MQKKHKHNNLGCGVGSKLHQNPINQLIYTNDPIVECTNIFRGLDHTFLNSRASIIKHANNINTNTIRDPIKKHMVSRFWVFHIYTHASEIKRKSKKIYFFFSIWNKNLSIFALCWRDPFPLGVVGKNRSLILKQRSSNPKGGVFLKEH